MTTTPEELQRINSKQKRDARRTGRAFGRACAAGDLRAMHLLAGKLNDETLGGWRQAFRFLPAQVHPDVPAAFLPIWIENKSIALDFQSSRPVLAGLRRLLLPYDGPSVTLYRGEFASRSRRPSQIGISWTNDLAVAEKFATDTRQCAAGGSVILQSLAPAEAIVSCLQDGGDHYREAEFFVDPRRLGAIHVHRSFPQVTLEDLIAREEEQEAIEAADPIPANGEDVGVRLRRDRT